MQCLQIPVDHQIRAIIRRMRCFNLKYERSDHVDILREFGTSLIYEDEPHPAAALEFAYDLAGPSTTGGIVVALDQPSASQKFTHGTVAEIDDCTTLRAIKQLIMVTSNCCYDIDDISIFDAIPVISAPYDSNNEVFQDGDEAFFQMIAAKQPIVLISCFKSKSDHPQMRELHSDGVGKDSRRKHVRVKDCSIKKVNAFHPSYAMNYHREFACFRRLLILEFAQAFGVWRGDWSEREWMSELRTECQILARQLYNAKPINAGITLSAWNSCWDPINKIFRDTNFFRLLSFQDEMRIYRKFVDTKLTWRLCDAGLFLLKADRSYDSEIWRAVEDSVTWCVTTLWPINKPRPQNDSNAPGLYAPASVPNTSSGLQSPYAQVFHNDLIRFVRDMNLTFSLSSQPNLKAQGHAFLRLAQSVEDGLERMNCLVDLDTQMESLKI